MASYLVQDDTSSKEGLLREYASEEESREIELARRPVSKNSLLLMHGLILSAYTAFYLVLFFRARPTYTKSFPTELPSVEPWLQLDDVVFSPSAFHSASMPNNGYEGAPTAEIDAAWEKLFDVGTYVLTEAENSQLPDPTIPYHKDPTKYPVVIAMYHQIHCLDRIRRVAWGNNNPMNETAITARKHTDHCIDYLRQVLICYGDTTPIPLYIREYIDGEPQYDSNWMVHHTCRNYDKIREWQQLRDMDI
ncbi:hypothetical protein PVAG01_11367 [Phlyctema vagabunda]|uniref:Uncharacterized protein n=1 Tax=Phlyctema vagabunda TaxID=108571 RepID=A0ABR4P2F8_9HELO